eukprot:jgi/Undpi1/12840/HiC_scaffold_7.g02507.m1
MGGCHEVSSGAGATPALLYGRRPLEEQRVPTRLGSRGEGTGYRRTDCFPPPQTSLPASVFCVTMISGDSTASHMGSVKNIEKARERRTFETMAGSSETGVPDDLLAHSESVHPRMGYDMSDSIFMQEMQAAGREKESKKALEERTALEAFRAAALQKPFDPSASTSTESSPFASGRRARSGSENKPAAAGEKRKPAAPLPPLAGIKLRRKTSRSEASPPEETGDKSKNDAVSGEATPTSSGKRKKHASKKGRGDGKGDGEGGADGGEGPEEAEKGEGGGKDGVRNPSKSKSSSSSLSNKKKKKKKHGKSKHSGSTGTGSSADSSAVWGGLGGGLGLVAYSSGEESDSPES